MSTNLQIIKAANDLAFATVGQETLEQDSALLAKAGELELSDAQYRAFKNSVNQFRAMYGQAANADKQAQLAAQRTAAKVPAAAAPPQPSATTSTAQY